MLPHRSILSNCRGAFELLRPLQLKDEIYLSYLPASHSYEHTVGQFFLPSIGTEIVYARGVEHLAADLLTVRPTIMTVVPRVLEVIRNRVLTQVARQTPLRQRLFQRAMAIGLKRLDAAPLTLAEAAARSAAGPAGARQGACPVRRPAGRGVFRRRAAGTGGGAVLPRARPEDPARLWPDRGRPDRQRQSAGGDPHRYRRPRAARASICASPRTARSWSAATW